METFLGNAARYLYGKWGDDISSVRILLPNTRSRLFFLDELRGLADRPLWQPRFDTIDGMMHEISGLIQADKVRAVVELYKVYAKRHQEKFDSFYFWGEVLLNDFDQVDKYLVDADMLFANLSDLKDLDDSLGYFSDEQRAVVRRFWESFGREEHHSDEKRDFLNIWQSLGKIYHGFRESLSSRGLAYTGMMHRAAAEEIRSGNAAVGGNGPVAVVGFNALTECEKILFDHLRNVCDAEFFWDYDDYYVSDKHQEAGLFMRENISRYGIPAGFRNDTRNFTTPKVITSVSAPSGVVQCKYASAFLNEVTYRQGNAGKETAIVLTDESLLVPLLYSIPASAGEINVTMGYPLRQTLAYSFVERLLRLQTHTRKKGSGVAFHHSDATGLLMHPFIMELDAENASRLNSEITARSQIYVKESSFRCGTIIETIFTKHVDWRELTGWIIRILSSVVSGGQPDPTVAEDRKMRREYAGLIADTLRKLSNSLENCDVRMDVAMFASLGRRMLQNLRFPYEGEPLRGIQVMGILETRNIDFRNVMIMSMNDDNFPGNPAASSSFIPYNLRLGYGLPTPQHHDGIYAYYFYRLLQRAEKVDMVYSCRTDENSSGEQSRYIYQLEFESPHVIGHKDIGLDVGIAPRNPITVEKDDAVMKRLAAFLDGSEAISPTALNAYLDCPLKFYFRYVARLKPDREVAEEIDMPMFGTILHRAMELLYRPFIGKRSPGKEITGLIGSETVREAVDKAVNEVYFHGEDVPAEGYEGNLLMVRDIVIRYIGGSILPHDGRLGDFTITALEKRLTSVFRFGTDKSRQVVFSGLADRVDRIPGGRIRIVDYKTGTPHADFAGTAALFGDDAREHNPAVLQTLLYSMIVTRMQEAGEMEGGDVCPALYYVRLMNKPDYSPLLNLKDGSSVTGYVPFMEDFEAGLDGMLAGLFEPSVPFTQCPDTKPCEYCEFAPICRRI